MERFKVIALYTGFWIAFAVFFAVMFAMFAVCAVGVPFGLMAAVMGIAVLAFRADFVLTQLAPELMLFGGLCGAFFAAFLGALAVKLGFIISRLFLRTRRRCDALRNR